MIAPIELFEALRTRFNEQEAKTIVREMEKIEKNISATVEKEFDRKKDALATKEDIGNLNGGLIAKIAESEARLTMRMFYFWIGQIAVLSGILSYFFKSLGH
jgi:ethanolamine utilization protein EutP (predicted NTPase)